MAYATNSRTRRHYKRVLRGSHLFQRQAKALVGQAYAEKLTWDAETLTAFCYERWTAPVVEVHSRRLKTVLSEQEKDRCVAWVVEYLLDPRSDDYFLNRQRELGRRGAGSRWGAPLDPRVLLLPEFYQVTQARIGEQLGYSARTIKRKFAELRELGLADSLLTAKEASDLRKLLKRIPILREMNAAAREEKRKAWLRRKARFVRSWKDRADRVRKAREHRFLVMAGWAGMTGFTGEVRVLRT